MRLDHPNAYELRASTVPNSSPSNPLTDFLMRPNITGMYKIIANIAHLYPLVPFSCAQKPIRIASTTPKTLRYSIRPFLAIRSPFLIKQRGSLLSIFSNTIHKVPESASRSTMLDVYFDSGNFRSLISIHLSELGNSEHSSTALNTDAV